jgi:oxygen-dependent protoporphyrinogen oxidase
VPNASSRSIAILGAGVTGLTAAYRLTQRGHRVRLFEAGGRVGGAVRTETVDGWLIEAGPNSLLAGAPAASALIDELGLRPECVTANPTAKKRYVVRRGRLAAVPTTLRSFLTSPLFSIGTKLRVLAETRLRLRIRTSDLSVEEFMRSHFGQEVVDYGLSPYVGGVYAGDPRKLSARYAFPKMWELEQRHGSLLRGGIAIARSRRGREDAAGGIFSFRRGLQTLTDALAARLPAGAPSLNATIEALVPGAPWSVIWNDGATTHTEKFDAVVAAVPAPALAQLRFGTLGERPLVALDAIEHPPVASLFLGYRREQVAHALDGFGLLAPAVEQRAVLGVLFSSSVFPNRAPAGYVALTVLAGGTRQPELARLPAEKLLAAVERDLRELLGVAGAPVFRRHTFWPRAIPQYNLGHEQHLEAMVAAERAHRGLFIGGQARDGIALPDCIVAGQRLALAAGGGG